ncbi:MAG: hypothetical protein JSW62_03010, partial [Thermoplasmatales archaeon]
MKKMLPKKIVVFYIMLVLTCSFFIPTGIFASEETEFNPLSIGVSQQGEEIEITYEINIFNEEPVNINGVEYSIIKIGEESNLLLAGKPNIPTICRSIMIPDTAKMKIEIIHAEYQHFENVLIAPSKGNLLRNVNPDDVPYEFGEVYTQDAYFPGKLATLREPYIIRDFRGQVIELYPIQYNP